MLKVIGMLTVGEKNDSAFLIQGKYWTLLPGKIDKLIQYFPNNDSVFSIAGNTDSVFLIPGTCWISMFEIYRPVRKTHCVHKWRPPGSHCRACQLRLSLIYHRYTSLCRPPSPQTPIWKPPNKQPNPEGGYWGEAGGRKQVPSTLRRTLPCRMHPGSKQVKQAKHTAMPNGIPAVPSGHINQWL